MGFGLRGSRMGRKSQRKTINMGLNMVYGFLGTKMEKKSQKKITWKVS